MASGNGLAKRILVLGRSFSLIAGALPILAAAGWLFHIDPLKQIHPSLPAMQPNTVFGLVASVIAVLFTGDDRRFKNGVACILGGVVSLLGVVTLSEYIFSWDAGIDRVFLGTAGVSERPYVGRPSPQTAANFIVFGVGLLVYNLRFLPIRLGQACALAVGGNAIVAMTGYIFSTRQFYGVPALPDEVGMAVHTALSFIFLAAALLFSRPHEGIMSLVTSDTRSGRLIRRILLAVIVAPAAVGALTHIGVLAGWYDVGFQVSLFAVVLMGLILRATWRAGRQSEREELQARAAFEESRVANERLKQANDERRVFEALIENSSDFIGIADANGKPMYLNPAGRRMVGLSEDYPVKNTQIPEYYPRDQRAFASDVIVRSMVEKGHWTGETWFRHWQTEEAIPVSDEHFMIRDSETGRVLGMGTVTRDISDIRRSQEQIRQSQERFELALRGADLAAWDWDVQSGKVEFSARWAEMRGFRPEEIKPHIDSWISGVHPEDWPRVQKALSDYFQGVVPEYQAEFRALTKSGDWIWILDRGKVFTHDDKGQPHRMAGTELDITERKRIENEQRFLAQVGAVLTTTLDSADTLANIAQLAVRDFADLCIVDAVDKDGGVRRLKAVSRDASKAWVCDLLMQVPLDGNQPQLTRSVIETRRAAVMERLPPEMIASFSSREEHVRALEAADFKSVIAVPLLAYGKLVGVITLISSSSSPRFGPADVRLAEELAQRVALSTENARLFDEAQRAVRTRDEVLAVVAHDLGNPLAAIALMAKSLRRFERSDRSKFEGFIEEIVRSVDHTLSLIEDLLSFARIQSGTFSVMKKVDMLSPVLMKIAEHMTVQAEAKRQKLEVDLFSNLSNVAIDARRMSQVLSNLIGNAIKFTPEGGTIRVSARQQGHEIVVSVTDTGPGIPPEHLSKVFDRFWQAQAAGYTGSGLGLSIAKGIVEAHGGRIWAESEVGQGSSFRFTLPAVDLELPQTGSAA